MSWTWNFYRTTSAEGVQYKVIDILYRSIELFTVVELDISQKITWKVRRRKTLHSSMLIDFNFVWCCCYHNRFSAGVYLFFVSFNYLSPSTCGSKRNVIKSSFFMNWRHPLHRTFFQKIPSRKFFPFFFFIPPYTNVLYFFVFIKLNFPMFKKKCMSFCRKHTWPPPPQPQSSLELHVYRYLFVLCSLISPLFLTCWSK